jgi:hypothetical protein
MNTPNPQEIRTALEERRRRDGERMRREEQAMDALAVRAVQSLTVGLPVVVEVPRPWKLEPSTEPTPIETMPAAGTNARSAIEARRQRSASSSPIPEPGEPPLHAALRGIVEHYAEPITPSERTVTDLETFSGVALDEADTDGLWADLELAEVLAVRAAMRDVVNNVTDRAECVIIDELVAAQARLAREYPDVPLPDASGRNEQES